MENKRLSSSLEEILEKARQVGEKKVGADGITREWVDRGNGTFGWRRVRGEKKDESKVDMSKRPSTVPPNEVHRQLKDHAKGGKKGLPPRKRQDSEKTPSGTIIPKSSIQEKTTKDRKRIRKMRQMKKDVVTREDGTFEYENNGSKFFSKPDESMKSFIERIEPDVVVEKKKEDERPQNSKIIGKTSSGKKIYDDGSELEQDDDWSSKDHEEAMDLYIELHAIEDENHPESDRAYQIASYVQSHHDKSKTKKDVTTKKKKEDENISFDDFKDKLVDKFPGYKMRESSGIGGKIVSFSKHVRGEDSSFDIQEQNNENTAGKFYVNMLTKKEISSTSLADPSKNYQTTSARSVKHKKTHTRKYSDTLEGVEKIINSHMKKIGVGIKKGIDELSIQKAKEILGF